jgi:hypothetical protein
MSCKPPYKKARLVTIQKKGRKTQDDLTGLYCYESDIVVQRGIRKDHKNKGSVDKDYGPGLYGYPLT